jgi:nucleotide-binding universal stress UspA family protein
MYRRILVAVENSQADRTILDHVAGLAKLTGAELLLVHVADGWAARNFDQLKLRESEEMTSDRAYLDGPPRDARVARVHRPDEAGDGRSGDRADSEALKSTTPT